MGYTTEFEGEFHIDKAVDEETYQLLKGLATSRRMKRQTTPKYGIDGEFYVEGGYGDEDKRLPIIDVNQPPRTQPSLWCNWEIAEDHRTISWNGAEKFYNYIDWIKYIIERILKPKDYVLNGVVDWKGEERSDVGTIEIERNKVTVVQGDNYG